MDYGTLQTRVSEEAGIDLATDSSKVGAWINGAYEHISGIYNWPWLFKNTIVQTVADITTGTVSINAGSTALTFTSGPTVSVANDYMIQFPATSSDWYYITSHTASSTSATLSVPFTGAGNISGASYICRKVFYSLASDCDRIIDFRQSVTKDRLEYIDPRTFDRVLPDPTATGYPRYYTLLGLDTSSNWRCNFYPIPSSVLNMQLRYYAKITELSASTDSPVMPTKWHNALVFGALAMYGHPYIDDTRMSSAITRFAAVIDEMKAHYSNVPDQRTVVQPWDTRPRSRRFELRYPSNYPDYYGSY